LGRRVYTGRRHFALQILATEGDFIVTNMQQRVLRDLRLELAEAGCELSSVELESMGQFLVLLDAAGSAEGLQRTLDRLAPTWQGDGPYSLLVAPLDSTHLELTEYNASTL
jgi:hypothetical protein